MAQLSDVVRVFISSKQQEFSKERRGMVEIVRDLPLLAVDIAEDWAPGRDSIESTYLARVRSAPIYVGLFGCLYSEPTVREYEAAIENPHREMLIYLKRCPAAEPLLADLIRRIGDARTGHTVKQFERWEDLRPCFRQHLWSAVRRMIENYVSLSEPSPTARGGAGIMVERWRRQRTHMLNLGLPGGEDPESARRWADSLIAMLAERQS